MVTLNEARLLAASHLILDSVSYRMGGLSDGHRIKYPPPKKYREPYVNAESN